jgi:hypothetical protein
VVFWVVTHSCLHLQVKMEAGRSSEHTTLHGVLTQKTTTWVFIAMKTKKTRLQKSGLLRSLNIRISLMLCFGSESIHLVASHFHNSLDWISVHVWSEKHQSYILTNLIASFSRKRTARFALIFKAFLYIRGSIHVPWNAYGYVAITDDSVELCMWSLVYRQIITAPTNSVWQFKLTDMATMRNLEIISDKYGYNVGIISAKVKKNSCQEILLLLPLLLSTTPWRRIG